MKIEKYTFGKLVINGKSYGDILIVDGDFVTRDWKYGSHRLSETEAKKLMVGNPDMIIIGTGMYGVMSVDKKIQKELEHVCELHITDTSRAVDMFNRVVAEKKKVNAMFHTTC